MIILARIQILLVEWEVKLKCRENVHNLVEKFMKIKKIRVIILKINSKRYIVLLVNNSISNFVIAINKKYQACNKIYKK